jgi:thymidylate synthase (FAD)
MAGDEKLLRYLYEHKHSTPFEMAGLTIEVKAPIFVFRQWHRHRTQSYNEMSARYTPLPDENYRPNVERCIVVPGGNKQARGVNDLVPTHEQVIDWLENYVDPAYEAAERAYTRGLEIGIPKELARIPTSVARYSAMRASANLRNWLAFLTLRMDAHAQYEIRVYAEAVGAFIRREFPRTFDLFAEGNGYAGH